MGKTWKLKKFTQTPKPVYIARRSNRFYVLVDIDGLVIPFYTSSGSAGKKDAEGNLFAVGDFFPIIGTSMNWHNKTNFTWDGEPAETAIDTYYGIPQFGKIAKQLNDSIDYENLKKAEELEEYRIIINELIVDANQGLDKLGTAPDEFHWGNPDGSPSRLRDNIYKIKEALGLKTNPPYEEENKPLKNLL